VTATSLLDKINEYYPTSAKGRYDYGIRDFPYKGFHIEIIPQRTRSNFIIYYKAFAIFDKKIIYENIKHISNATILYKNVEFVNVNEVINSIDVYLNNLNDDDDFGFEIFEYILAELDKIKITMLDIRTVSANN